MILETNSPKSLIFELDISNKDLVFTYRRTLKLFNILKIEGMSLYSNKEIENELNRMKLKSIIHQISYKLSAEEIEDEII
jgi:hypothetical protein